LSPRCQNSTMISHALQKIRPLVILPISIHFSLLLSHIISPISLRLSLHCRSLHLLSDLSIHPRIRPIDLFRFPIAPAQHSTAQHDRSPTYDEVAEYVQSRVYAHVAFNPLVHFISWRFRLSSASCRCRRCQCHTVTVVTAGCFYSFFSWLSSSPVSRDHYRRIQFVCELSTHFDAVRLVVRLCDSARWSPPGTIAICVPAGACVGPSVGARSIRR